jgi:saccharopine dehydrogenase-like NADP-dependent oxidoreductase
MRILLLGATGMFGKRLAALLVEIPGIVVVLAGRNAAALETLRDALSAPAGTAEAAAARIELRCIDLDAADGDRAIVAARPDVLIDTCGPFQQRDYRLPRLAIATRFHYIDLADAPDFVAGIGVLDAQARAAGVIVSTGASSVPALSAAVIDAHRHEFSALHDIDVGIAPGNRAERGLATVRSILGAVGRPHAQFIDGALRMLPMWGGPRRQRYAAPVGTRWLADCAVPDALVLPQRLPGLRNLRFGAGVELRRMHFGLWLAGWLVRLRLLDAPERYAVLARRISERWLQAGSDHGAMHVTLAGTGIDGRPHRVHWQLIAEHGDGPSVPAAAAATVVRLIREGRATAPGAAPCIGWVPLDEIRRTLATREIRFLVERPGGNA